MRILQVHNSYQQAGGEDTVVSNEKKLLAKNNCKIHFHSVSNDSVTSFQQKVKAAWQSTHSTVSQNNLTKAINACQPDVTHVHNFFPILSPSIYEACQEQNVPVVQTLHNFRTICAGALLQRNGSPCEDCIDGSPYQAVFHKCYRNSRLGSFAVARMVDTHRRKGTWHTKVDRFIALTEFAKSRFVAAGFPEQKIVVKPNFVADPGPVDTSNPPKDALFVGRISREKGIETLLKAWRKTKAQLKIIGEGPLFKTVQENNLPQIFQLGQKNQERVYEEMRHASYLVLPSTCYEGFPMTIVEAFAHGLPVIASRLGAMAEIIEDGFTGLHFTAGDAEDLAAKVTWAENHPDEMRQMGSNARKVYEEKYTADINYRQLMAIYEEAIDENKNTG